MAASANNQAAGNLSDIRRKLILRMGVAGIMIVGLLGGLALFDYMSSRVESEPEATHYSEPVPVAKKTVTQPVTPIEPPVEIKEEKKEPPAPEVSAAPIDKSAPKLDLPPRPVVAAQPVLAKPAVPSIRPAGPGASTHSAPLAAQPRVSESRAAPVYNVTARSEPPAQRPLPPSPPRLFSGFALQAGVFAEPRRAEELHARLTLEGIPSTIEARVQVGPFNSKEEAEAARVKMKSMGIDAVLLMPSKIRR